MSNETLAEALEREHKEIDAGLESFAAGVKAGENRVAALTGATAALRRHIYLEEELLFPPLQKTGLVAAIFAMLREHGDIWKSMDQLEAEVAASAGADSALAVCKQLFEQIESHNSKEEQIVYPQADSALTPEAHAAMEAFLASGQMPAGWVCARART
jgi:hemerythrin-like domain-containing protein